MMYFNPRPDLSAEDYLFESCYFTRWQRFKARFLGLNVYMGKYKPIGAADWMEFYLIWCKGHKKYKVSHLHGNFKVTICDECERERRNAQKKPLRLVKS